MTKCIVCGQPVNETSAPTSEFRGEIFYFACPSCKARFDQDPERYLKGGPEAQGHAGHHGH